MGLRDVVVPRHPHAHPSAWMPALICPGCGAPIVAHETSATCEACGRVYGWHAGVLALITAERMAALEPFLRQYRLVRGQEGHRSAGPEYYRRLPEVAPDDPRASEWRLRRESFANLLRQALPQAWAGPLRILDLGAGSGWLSFRLASIGHDAVAVDCLDDEEDGLRVARHYDVPITAVQADFESLPFAPAQFDVAIFNASLHYARNPAATLTGAARLLKPGGTMAVMDSPVFVREHDGQAMVADVERRLSADYGLAPVVQPGQGFLTFAEIERAFQDLNLRPRFFRSRGVLPWRVRRQFARLKLRRSPAAFGVWVAR